MKLAVTNSDAVLKAFKISPGTLNDLKKYGVEAKVTENGVNFTCPKLKNGPVMKVSIPPNVIKLALDGELQPMSMQNIAGNIAQAINKAIAAAKVHEAENMAFAAEAMESTPTAKKKMSKAFVESEAPTIDEVFAATGTKSKHENSKYPYIHSMPGLPGLYDTCGGPGSGAYRIVAIGTYEAVAVRYYAKKLHIIVEVVNGSGQPDLTSQAVSAAQSAGMELVKFGNDNDLGPYRAYMALVAPTKLLAAKAVGAIIQELSFHNVHLPTEIPDPNVYL